jgi:hypothetical protein
MEVFFPFSLIERLRMGECGMRLLRSGADYRGECELCFHGTDKYVKPFHPARLALDKPRNPDKSGSVRQCLGRSNVVAFSTNLTGSTSKT